MLCRFQLVEQSRLNKVPEHQHNENPYRVAWLFPLQRPAGGSHAAYVANVLPKLRSFNVGAAIGWAQPCDRRLDAVALRRLVLEVMANVLVGIIAYSP